MRRPVLLFVCGLALLLLSLPLWSAMRAADCSDMAHPRGGCERTLLYYPAGYLALALTALGMITVIIGCWIALARRGRNADMAT